MNAPAQIRIPREERTGPEIRLDETAAERAHRASISIHLPNENEFAMAARCDIAAMRDRASAGSTYATDEAAVILDHVARLATHAVYAPMPVKRLFLMRCALASLMEAARALERAARDEHGGR